MTSQHCKGSEKRSPTKVVSFGLCKNCRGTCTNTFKLPLERFIIPNFVCHAQLCSHAKKAPLLRNNNPLCITTITFSNTSVTPIIIIIQSPKKAPQKKSATMQERKKETFLLSPRFARAAKWIYNNALLVAGDTTALPPHSHHLKRSKKLRQLPIEIFFPLYCYR